MALCGVDVSLDDVKKSLELASGLEDLEAASP
jgi:hypothetical protein